MTTSRLLLPLRFPELGPALGKLVTGTGRVPGGFVLETHRVQLVNKIIERAGEARRLAAHEDRAAAIAALDRDAWLAAWEETVSGIGEAILASVEERIGLEAVAARMPPRKRARLTLTESDRRGGPRRGGGAGGTVWAGRG